MEENNLIVKDVSEILMENAKDYYKEIILNRAIPDYRDGLTFVQRRIIYICEDKKWNSSKQHVKSARITGEVMGRLHPHGNASIYDAMTIMGMPWKQMITLIDFHGSCGSISGSPAAAERYSEARTSKIAEDILLTELKYNCVDKQPNYSQDEEEPVVLPSKLPIYLINGAFGIAAGYAVSVPTHNPKEVINELINKIQNPNYSINILPDFPTGGKIINTDEIKLAYKDFNNAREKGYNKIVLRATIVKDEKNNTLTITEIPYMKTINTIIASIIDCCVEKNDKLHKGKKIPPKIIGIKDVKDLTNNNQPRVLIKCKKDTDLDALINQLYKYTQCQVTIPMSFIGVGPLQNFKIFNNIDEFFEEFIQFRKVTIQRIKSEIIKKYKLRSHILEGLLHIYKNNYLDSMIKLIKNSRGKSNCIELLMNNYDLTEIQSTYISETPLYKISNLEIEKLENEYKDLEIKIESELVYFKDKSKLEELMINELKEYKLKFKNVERKTKLKNISYKSESSIVDSIPDEDFMLLCTKKGYVKKLPIPKTQNRGGKGISVGKLKEDDYVISTTILNSKDSILIFGDKGKVYKFNVYDIPTHNTSNLGYNISKDINNEVIVNMISIHEDDYNNENIFIMIATKLNKIKLVSMEQFKNVRVNGIIYTKLNELDNVLNVEKVDKTKVDSIIALNGCGNSICVSIDDIPVSQRVTIGADLFDNSILGKCEVVSCVIVDESKQYYFLITNNGLGKLMRKSEFTLTKRRTKGRIAVNLKDNLPIKMIPCNITDSIILVSNKNIINIPAKKISIVKRPTYGSTIKKCEDGEYIVDCTI